jgi:acyl-coenzyme A thioesterase PaaI-like protein
VAGARPTGPINPTVDLNVQLVGPLPPSGLIHLVCHPVKVGRRLFVGEVILDSDGVVFARGTATFLNRRILDRPVDGLFNGTAMSALSGSVDEALALHSTGPQTLVLEMTPAVMNYEGGTVQGGIKAMVAEIATEHVLSPAGAFAVTDLDIRYLNRVKAGPLVAVADVVARTRNVAFVRVGLYDGTAADAPLAALATTVGRRLDPSA